MSEEKLTAPFTYNLTAMVGRRANDGRTMTVMTFEINKRHFFIALCALPAAAIVGLVAGTIIGIYGVFPFMAVMAAAFWLFASDTREGLRVKQWQALNDRRTSTVGKVFICGREVDPSAVEILNVYSGTVPLPLDNDDIEDRLDELAPPHGVLQPSRA